MATWKIAPISQTKAMKGEQMSENAAPFTTDTQRIDLIRSVAAHKRLPLRGLRKVLTDSDPKQITGLLRDAVRDGLVRIDGEDVTITAFGKRVADDLGVPES